MDTIRAEYVGFHAVVINGKEYDETQLTLSDGLKINKTGVMPAVCRELIAEGVPEDTLIEVWRGKVKCFNPTEVGWWAGKSVREDDRKSAMFRDYAPYPDRREG